MDAFGMGEDLKGSFASYSHKGKRGRRFLEDVPNARLEKPFQADALLGLVDRVLKEGTSKER